MHSLASTTGGLTFSWGDNARGQCGHPPEAAQQSAQSILRPMALYSLLDHAPIVSLAAGCAHSVFVGGAGHLFVCGDGTYGQLCAEPELLIAGSAHDGATTTSTSAPVDVSEAPHAGPTGRHTHNNKVAPEPCLVPMAQPVVAAACGAYHTVLLMRAQSLPGAGRASTGLSPIGSGARAALSSSGAGGADDDEEGMHEFQPLAATNASLASVRDHTGHGATSPVLADMLADPLGGGPLGAAEEESSGSVADDPLR